ncbi:MAG: hypothetical protein FK732_07375 [Asgard group archaeon]|nr:hypothetical protein [Asgard group archaeon]
MDLENCIRCMGYSEIYSSSAIIHTEKKPNLEYKADLWKPNEIKVLFLAEAPPFHSSKSKTVNDSYFYNQEESQRFFGAPSPLLGTLSWNLFWLLGINNKLSKKEKLEAFREKSCYYVNVVKCRTERYDKKNLINRTVKNCSFFLEKEIKELKPNSIVVLGERALYGLKCCELFKGLIPSNSINSLVEETKKQPLKIKDFKLYFLPLPIWRNRQYLESIQLLFKLVKREIQ